MAELLTALVEQRKTERGHMMQMQERMMPHMMGHTMQGMDQEKRASMQSRMSKCPMMSGMRPQEQEPDETPKAEER